MSRNIFAFVLSGLLVGSSSAVRAEVTVEEVKEAVLKELRAEKSSSADTSVFNPAMGLVLDVVVSNTDEDDGQFQFRGAELNFQSSIDPFGKVYAIINGNDEEVEVEEAAIVTNPLPGNITIRFGRFFANFGRLPKFHEHELPFVNAMESVESIVGGETKSDGVELTHLFRTPFFLQGTLGASNKIGEENDRLEDGSGATDGDTKSRPWRAMTYNARLATFIPIGDQHGIDLGISEAFTPEQRYIGGQFQDLPDSDRSLSGVDITYRFEPVQKSIVKKLTWGTEVFYNDERRLQDDAVDTDGDTIGDTDSFERRSALGGFTYIEARVTQLLGGGAYHDISEDVDDPSEKTRTWGAFFNIHPSEFQRVRLQYSRNDTDSTDDVYIQWTAVIGRHAHAFKDR